LALHLPPLLADDKGRQFLNDFIQRLIGTFIESPVAEVLREIAAKLADDDDDLGAVGVGAEGSEGVHSGGSSRVP